MLTPRPNAPIAENQPLRSPSTTSVILPVSPLNLQLHATQVKSNAASICLLFPKLYHPSRRSVDQNLFRSRHELRKAILDRLAMLIGRMFRECRSARCLQERRLADLALDVFCGLIDFQLGLRGLGILCVALTLRCGFGSVSHDCGF